MKKYLITFLFFGVFSNLVSAVELTPVDKEKILFMVFENQSKKTIPMEPKNCKVEKADWYCKNNTVKNFLMGLYRYQSGKDFTFNSSMDCELIDGALLKRLDSKEEAKKYGALEFIREIKQSLKNQYVCRFKTEQTFFPEKDEFDGIVDESVSQMSLKTKTQLVFIMNRDHSRIVSKRFSLLKSDI